jgi:hypothetical protein
MSDTGGQPRPLPATPVARHFTTNRPVAVLMVFPPAVVFGFFSFKRLPVTLMPELTYPTLTVRTEYPGAAPEEVENEISRPIEEGLGVHRRPEQASPASAAPASAMSPWNSSGASICPRPPRKPSKNWTWSSCRAKPNALCSCISIPPSIPIMETELLR